MTKKSKPNLILLAGSAGSGKTYVCTQEFEAALRESENLLADDLLFILPTAEHRSRALDLILRKNSNGFFQRRVTTFDRALKELLRLGGFEFATDVTRRIILSEILERVSLKYFANSSNSRGFLELVSRMIIEFKEQLIPPSEIKNRLDVIKNNFPEFSLKYDDVCHIFQAYDEELKKRNLIDQRDSLRLLEEGLTRGEFKDPELKRVWMDGFSDFSKLQLAFIDFLTRHANEVTVTLTVDQNPYRKPLFETVSDTQAALLDMGFQSKWLEGENHRSQNKTLAHLERQLFTQEKVKKISLNDEIQVFEATGLEGEMEMIAREIKKLALERNYHFSDIAVLFRSTDPYISVLQSVFSKFEIPYEFHERFKLRLTPIARTVTSFLDIFLNQWNRKDIFNFLKSIHWTRSGEEASALELQAQAKGIYKDRKYWLETFPNSKILKELAAAEDQFLKLKNSHQFGIWLKNHLKQFGFFAFPDQSDLKIRMDREAAKRILLLIEELKNKLRKKENLEPEQIARELMTLIEVDLFSVHSRDINRVQIYNVSLARQKEYKAVFIAGLLEKQFPIQIKEDPIFSDLERRELNKKGKILKERLPRQAFERYLFYMAVTRARERLILSFPRFDLEGKEALPSFYIEEVRLLFEGELKAKKQPITEVLPKINEIATYEEAEKAVIQELWNSESDQKDQKTVFALFDFLNEKSDFHQFINRIIKPIEGVLINTNIAAHLVPKQNTWSPTFLEEYAECSYRFFAHRGLGLEEQEEGIDIRRRGIILHDVLETFFAWQKESKREMNFEEAKEFCTKKFNQLWDEEPLMGDRHYKIELERRKMLEMILQVLRLELTEKKPPLPGLTPAYFEYEFDDVILKGRKRDIKLRGKIDRVDTDSSGQYALVIDYKSGKQFEMYALENGIALQLPFYLIAIEKKLGLKPLGGHLYSLSNGKSKGFHHQDHMDSISVTTRKGNRLSKKYFDEVVQNSVLFAEKFVGEIEEGKIPIRPRDCVPYCSYSSICRIEKWRLDHLYQEITAEDKKWLKEQRK